MSVEHPNFDLNLRTIFDDRVESDLIAELKSSEHNYQALIDTVEGVVWEADPKTFQFSFVSKSAVKMFGYPVQQWLDNPTFWKDHIHPDDRDRAVSYCIKCTRQKRSHELEYRMIAKDGKEICIHDNVSVIVENGEATLLRGIMTDCTRRKESENKLIVQNEIIEKRAAELLIANLELVFQNQEKEKRASELFLANRDLKNAQKELIKLSMVAKETSNGVAIRDKDQNIVWINNAFTKMYGYELNEVAGQNPLVFLQGAETDQGLVAWVYERIGKKYPFVFEINYYTKDSVKKCVRVQIQPIFDEFGEVIQSFALHTDITEQKRLAEQVELEKIIKLKEITDAVFATQESERSDIGRELHDNVNQLLGATHLYIELAKNEVEKNPEILNNASAFTLKAIEELRKLSKTLITPLMEDIALTDIINDLVEDIKLVHPVKIEITAENFCEDGLTDKFKLNIYRIVQEQVNNILKHAQAENIYINIEDNYGKLLLSITDNGVGFDTDAKRSGVGITNIKSRIELYNGYVRLNSEPGMGTTLSITFNKNDQL